MKEFLPALSAATFLACKVFSSVQLGMKRHENALPSKAHWSGGSKIKATLKVIIKRKSLPGPFKFSWAQESFRFPPVSAAAPRGWKRTLRGGCFDAVQQPRLVA